MKDQNMRLASVFVLGVLVGVGGFWLREHRTGTIEDLQVSTKENFASTTDLNIATSPIVETEGSVLVTSSPHIQMADQNPGKLVVVAQAVLDAPAWVVIRDSVNGKPGNVLGARLFDKGKNSGLIQLLRATEVGKQYIAVLHAYSGVKKPFDVKSDLPLKNQNGDSVMAAFSVTKATN